MVQYLRIHSYSNAVWRHRSGSTLAQGMFCCLTAPSHYQCWLIINGVPWHLHKTNFTAIAQDIISSLEYKYVWKIHHHWFRVSQGPIIKDPDNYHKVNYHQLVSTNPVDTAFDVDTVICLFPKLPTLLNAHQSNIEPTQTFQIDVDV